MKTIYRMAFAVVAMTIAAAGYAQDASRGADSYRLCASCHGFQGEGNQLVNAPRLAGQESWYLERQIRNYRDGVRGGSNDDTHGQTMAKMTLGLKSDADIANIVAHIATLPIESSAATLGGDAGKGKSLYATCIACHGANAEGNKSLNAPALAGMDDWYQLSQLAKFKSGQRGANAADTYGAQMAPMAGVLADEQAMKDVIAYINSL